MLPLPNLDDRLFEEIVSDARRMIPKMMPQWTDENAHDPGITMIELFSWLTEMQQYYLNRVTTKNELAFLRLLGVQLKQAASAATDVTFGEVEKELLLPEGTKLLAEDQPFETDAPLWLFPASIDRVLVSAGAETFDVTASNTNIKAVYHAFGADAKAGNRLLLAFDRELPTDVPVTLTFSFFENEAVAVPMPASGKLEIIPSAQVEWCYYGLAPTSDAEGQNAPAWQPLTVNEDETFHLSRRGRVTFHVPAKMMPTTIHPAKDKQRFWLSCTVKEAGYEIVPKLENISLNTGKAVQRDTHSTVLSFDSTGEAGLTLETNHFLACFEHVTVQVQEPNGLWRYWDVVGDLTKQGPDSPCCQVVQTPGSLKAVLRFGDGTHGKIPPKGKRNIRIIAHKLAFSVDRYIGQSNGLPNQRFELPREQHIAATMRLQVGVKVPGTEQYLWQDWERVDTLDHSTGDDRHFVYDPTANVIVFGDNEKGEIPPASDTLHICLIGLQTGGGVRGNVKEKLITQIIAPPHALPRLTVTNHYAAQGGTEYETLEQAKLRARKEQKQPGRAVTSDDYEAIVRHTPGLRVARVKAIPLYVQGTRDYPQQIAPAQVTVAVMPYSDAEKPMPSPGFLETVKRHLDPHRLLTTELHIVPPEYVKITVYATVVIDPLAKNVQDKVVKALRQFFQPLDRTDVNRGWAFGHSVYKGDVFGVINQLPGVEFIQDLWFDAEGNGIHKDQSGDIHLPPHGLVYSGEHQIEVVKLTDV